MRAHREFINTWKRKAVLVQKMRKMRREFLGKIFKREMDLMVGYY